MTKNQETIETSQATLAERQGKLTKKEVEVVIYSLYFNRASMPESVSPSRTTISNAFNKLGFGGHASFACSPLAFMMKHAAEVIVMIDRGYSDSACQAFKMALEMHGTDFTSVFTFIMENRAILLKAYADAVKDGRFASTRDQIECLGTKSGVEWAASIILQNLFKEFEKGPSEEVTQ